MSKHVGLKAIVILAVFCIVFSTFSIKGEAAVLPDIPKSAEAEIKFLIDQRVVSGYPDRTFRPERAVTRAEAAIMLGKALGLNSWRRATPFKDVASNSVASGYIASAASKGIIKGFPDGTFRPEERVTRGQMALFLQRAFKLTETSDISFKDIPKSGEQYKAINTVATAGLAAGYPDGTFQPNDSVTRQEFAVFVARALNEDFRVKAPTPAPAPTPTPEPAPTPGGTAALTGKVTADVLNVRSGPSSTHAVIGTLPHGAEVAIQSFNGYWAQIKFNNQTGYVHKTYLKLKNLSGSPVQNRIIVIDPGHGGLNANGRMDPGALYGNMQEKDITLAVANRVTAKLRAAGANVVQTRTGDVNRTFLLEDRVQIARDNKAELFVSIHVNSAGSPAGSGTETYYDSSKNANSAESRELAEEIQKQLIALAGTKNRGVKDNSYYVIREQNIPSVLVELGFISNAEDRAKLASPEYHEIFAQAIFQGIYNYYSK